MDVEARQAAVAALTRLARSRHPQDRADAGRGLASFADLADAREILSELVNDPDDSFVTLATAEALLRRGDAAGLAIVAAAAAVAEYEQLEWLFSAVQGVLGVFERDRDVAIEICRGLTDVAVLLDWLAQLDPPLRAVHPPVGLGATGVAVLDAQPCGSRSRIPGAPRHPRTRRRGPDRSRRR